jgi:hypothetical protein
METGRRSKCSKQMPGLVMLVTGAIFLAAGTAIGQSSQSPQYPKVNVSISYEVDPSWPQRPQDVQWGAMPGVALDRQGRVYAFTRAKPPVQIYSPEGKFLGSRGDKEIKTAHYLKIEKDGTIWISDIGNHLIMQFTPEGKLLREFGTRGVAGQDASHFNMPTDMAIAPSGDIFVSDGYVNNRVVHFDRSGKFVKEWGRLGTKPGEFSLPHAIAIDSKGRLYVADRNNARVQIFDQGGKLLEVWSDLLVPWGFFVQPSGDIWVCGSAPMTWQAAQAQMGVPPKDQLFMRFSPAGKLLQLWTVPKGQDGREKPGELNWVHGIAIDSAGNIYAGDINGKRIQKFIYRKPG